MLASIKTLFAWLNAIALLMVLLSIASSPFLGILIAIEYFSGSGGALNQECEIDSIQSRFLAYAMPEKFWTEQVVYLDNQIRDISHEPEILRENVERGMQMLADATAKLRIERPELFNTNKSQASQAADALRRRADDIDNAELVRAIELDRIERLIRVQRCRNISATHLAAK